MNLTEEFRKAAERVQLLDKRPSNEDLLQLYALYKQATDGDLHGERPGGFDFKAMAKYDAWSKLKGTSPEEAMEAYIKLVDSLVSAI